MIIVIFLPLLLAIGFGYVLHGMFGAIVGAILGGVTTLLIFAIPLWSLIDARRRQARTPPPQAPDVPWRTK